MTIALALLAGVLAGLRAMTPLAAASWAARLGFVNLEGTWLAFLGYFWTPIVLTVLAFVELVTDQLPWTPSRTVPQQFGARLVTGALAGMVFASSASMAAGATAGVVGAIIGTIGGARARARLAASFGRDLPAALVEDAVTIIGAFLVVLALR